MTLPVGQGDPGEGGVGRGVNVKAFLVLFYLIHLF